MTDQVNKNESEFSTSDIGVPVQKHITLVYIILLIIGGACITIGIGLIASIAGLISEQISNFFYQTTGWSPYLTYLVFGCLGLLVGTIIVSYSGRLNNFIVRFINGLKTIDKDDRPREYINLKSIPYTYKVKSLIDDHNCKVFYDNDGKGFKLYCDDLDDKRLQNIMHDRFSKLRKSIELILIVVIPLILTITAYEGWWLHSNTDAWIWFCIIIFCIIVGIEISTYPMWFSVLIGWGFIFTGYFMLLPPISINTWWTFVGVWLAYTCVIFTYYYMKPNLCKVDPQSFICDRR